MSKKKNKLTGIVYCCYNIPEPRVMVYHSYKQMCKDLKSRCSAYMQRPNNYMCCTYDRVVDGKVTYVVLTNFSKKDTKTERRLALVHEAVHCADMYFSYIGELNPSKEMRAYVTQGIAETLWYLCEL